MPPGPRHAIEWCHKIRWGINLLMFNKVKFNQIMSISGKPQKVTLINRIGSYYTHHSKVQAAANIFSFHDFFCREVLPSHSTLGTCSRRRPCCYNNKVPSNDRDFNTSHPISFCRILWPIPPLPPGGPPTTIRYWGALWVF